MSHLFITMGLLNESPTSHNRVLFENRLVARVFSRFPTFREKQIYSLPEKDKSNPHPFNCLFKLSFNINLSSTASLPNGILPAGFPTKVCVNFSLLSSVLCAQSI